MTKLRVLWVASLIGLMTAAPPAGAEERLSFGLQVGASLPVTIGSRENSLFPTLGFDVVYRPIPWLGIGASTQSNLFLPKSPPLASGVILENALLVQALFFVGDTGFYGGVRGGMSIIYDAYTSGGQNGTMLAPAFGPKAGYQFHFAGSSLALGPEWSMLVVSSSSHGDATSTVTIPSHTIQNLGFVLKWWLE